jgi:hypothetical protein
LPAGTCIVTTFVATARMDGRFPFGRATYVEVSNRFDAT